MENGYLLISDLDGTLLGDDEALKAFADWYDRRRHQIELVYNSGRFVRSVLDVVESTELPMPGAVIGGVGTQIERVKSKRFVGDWPVVDEGWDPQRIKTLLASYDALELQPTEFQSEYKVSYYAESASRELLEELKTHLETASIRAELIYSSDRDLDVLPRGVDKGSAAAYLASFWEYPSDRVLVSGDTGNDIALFSHGFRGIVVGNARRELKQLHYPTVHHASKSHAAGVMEGIDHWMSS